MNSINGKECKIKYVKIKENMIQNFTIENTKEKKKGKYDGKWIKNKTHETKNENITERKIWQEWKYRKWKYMVMENGARKYKMEATTKIIKICRVKVKHDGKWEENMKK